MNKTAQSATILLMMCIVLSLHAQDSDFEYKEAFLEKAEALETSISLSASTAELDELKLKINSFEADYARRREFLDKALYPDTYTSVVAGLRKRLEETYARLFIIQAQGTKIESLESRLVTLIQQIDSVNLERTKAFNDLRTAQRSNSSLREAVNRLKATLLEKDKLIFALIDSIFLPFESSVAQAGDSPQRELRRKLEESNALQRVYEIASDNLRFIEVMRLQGRDFVPVVDQFNRFEKRWGALRGKIAGASTEESAKTSRGEKLPSLQAGVDSILADWRGTLNTALWNGVRAEFTAKGIFLPAFHDGQTFKEGISAHLESARITGSDETVFVEEVWKGRIDKEWRATLSQESVLGVANYAQLDLAVSEFGVKALDWRTVGVIAAVFVIVIGSILFRARKDKRAAKQAISSKS